MKLLVVEDDLALADVIAFALRRAGFEVISAHDGITALDLWEREQPDLMVLDLNLPRLDGMAVCRRVRAQGDTPIIILSVRGGDEDVVVGLELGADDYVVKPFSPSQLVARVKAVLRRVGKVVRTGPLSTAHLALDRSRNEVSRGGQVISLTPLEAQLLEAFMLNNGHVLPYDGLVSAVWGLNGGDRVMLKQLAHRLRAKLEPDPANPIYITTVAGVGYLLNDQAADQG